MSTWLKLNAWPTSNQGGGIWSDIDGYSKNGVVVAVGKDGKIGFRVGDTNSFNYLASPASLTTGQWHHVVCTYDNSAMKIFVDGVLTTNQACFRVITDNTRYKLIGQMGWGPYYLDGCLDDLQVYNYALSPHAVAEMMGNANMVAHWKLDETSGVVAADASGYTNKATANSLAWVAGKIDNAALLTAAGSQRLAVADNPTFNYAKGVTVSTWLKLNSLPGRGGGGIWSDIDAYSKNGTVVYVNPNGKIDLPGG